MRTWASILSAVAIMTAVLVGVPPSAQDRVGAATGAPTAVDIEFTATEAGYYVLDSYGRVSTFGNAPYYGGSPALRTNERAVSISPTPTGLGYWIFTDLGRVFTYGDAQYYGDLDHLTLDGPVLDSVPTPSGLGYYMLGDDGGIFSFGDAAFFGSIPGILPPGTQLDGKIVGIAPTPTSLGYWLVGEDGGMFSFGDAAFFGSIPGVLPPGTVLDKPVRGMVPQGQGYLMVAADGGIFSFGQSVFHGSIPGLADPTARVQSEAQEIVAVMVRSDNSGYIMLSANGQIWAFGSTQALGTPDISTPANPGDVVDCSDFATQVEAQRWHDWVSPFYGDVANLDSDGDGRVCESLASSPAQNVTSTDGNLTIDVPEGAAPPGVTVTIEPAPANAFGPNQVGAAYRLGPDGTTFAGPVTITLRVADLPANVRSGSLQLGLRSTSGEITGLSTRLRTLPDGSFELTSATNHFTVVGAHPDGTPVDPGLMTVTCSTNGGPSFGCNKGPLLLEVGDDVSIGRTGGLAGPGGLNVSSSSPDRVLVLPGGVFRCKGVGSTFITAQATSVPTGVPVTPFNHLLVFCEQPGVTDTISFTSPGEPTSAAAPRIDSAFLGRTEGGGFRVGVGPAAPSGADAFGALFLDNPIAGVVEALTTRNEKHVGPDIGDVSRQVFFGQDGTPLPDGYGVTTDANSTYYDLPSTAGNRSIIRTESTSGQGFDSDSMDTKFAVNLAEVFDLNNVGPVEPCEPSATTLCLLDGRFKFEVEWTDFGGSGHGGVIDAGHEGGFFYFFNPDSADLVVRLLDGCRQNDRFWLFFGATGSVGYDMTVTDTSTGGVTRYGNQLGQPARAVTDTSAFATCP